jgi:putative SOS response-associated peptidase YedK
MCGRIVRERDEWGRRFGFDEESSTRLGNWWVERYNIAPTQLDVLVRPTAETRELVASRWGLVPRWAKERSVGSKMFNARAETLHERASFRTLIAAHRCIIPVSGFYEWQREGRTRQPMYIHRTDSEPIALAGLWTEWPDPESGELLTTHTVITCAPNGTMAPIHNRMPVILDDDGLDAWLDPGVEKVADVLPLLVPCPDDVLTAYPVSTAVNTVRNDEPELIRPLAADH